MEEIIQAPQTEEKKEEMLSSGSQFFRRGTTPSNSPPSSQIKKSHQVNSSAIRKISKDNTAIARKVSKEERASIVAEISKVPALPAPAPAAAPVPIKQEVPPPKPPKVYEPAPNPVSTGNGQLHTEYHSYLVKAPVKVPPPEEPEDEEPEITQSSLARMPPSTPKLYGTLTPKAEPKLRKQESIKPKSLAETKKASFDITNEALDEEMVCLFPKFMKTDVWDFCKSASFEVYIY